MKISEVNQIPGVKDVFTFLRFLDDSDQYRGYIEKMESLREQLNARIEAIGDIQDIEELRQDALNDRAAAKSMLDEARIEDERIRAQLQADLTALAEKEKSLKDATAKLESDRTKLESDKQNFAELKVAAHQEIENRNREAKSLLDRANQLDQETKRKARQLEDATRRAVA